MAFSLIDIITAIFGFLRGIFLISIIVLIFTMIGLWLYKKIKKRLDLSWFKAILLATFIQVFIIVLILYAYPAIQGFQEQTYGELPIELQPTIIEIIGAIALSLIRIILSSIMITFFLLPLIFIGTYAFDKLKQKMAFFLKAFIAVFISTLIGGIAVFILFPWILPGIVQLVFFA